MISLFQQDTMARSSQGNIPSTPAPTVRSLYDRFSEEFASSPHSVLDDHILTSKPSPKGQNDGVLFTADLTFETKRALKPPNAASNIVRAPVSILRYGVDAPPLARRKKSVTFASEVIFKQKTSCHHSGTHFAFDMSDEMEEVAPKPTQIICSLQKCNKLVMETLQRRVETATWALAESSFEVEFNQNEIDQLIYENKGLKLQLKRIGWKMGYEMAADEETLDMLSHKLRKYTTKIQTLKKEISTLNKKSAKLSKILQQSS
jgi:hypothetical protein